MRILIVAPHSLCRIRDWKCDPPTQDIATKLHKALPNSELILADQYRDEGDYNRIKTRNTPWRSQVRQLARDSDVILEIHSFPNYASEFRQKKLALVSTPENAKNSQLVIDKLAVLGIDVLEKVIQTNAIDLMADIRARYPNKQHYLLEFNQDQLLDLSEFIHKMGSFFA